MQALPLIISLLLAVAIAPSLVSFLSEGGHLRSNYRGEMLPCPLGILITAAALTALIPLALLAGLVDANTLNLVGLPLILGVAALGIADDAFAGSSRGWRGHGGAAMKGSFSTGVLKAVGTLGLALAWSAVTQPSVTRFLLATVVIVLATNFFNLLDLRPGRSVKGFIIVGAGCVVAAWSFDSLLSLGLWVGPILVCGALDLRERGILGDSGSTLIGVVAGLWLVLVLGVTGLAIAAAVLAIFTIYGEVRSINSLIEATPGLRHLDSLGRITRA